MNYVTINGVRSTTVRGLLIQSLPPITKPRKRTQIETIDGRDGDIVTDLGYEAYDREISVGLHGDYDVDNVIQFFDTKGIIIFSNEPDKYYIFEMIEQIDFERLCRFRTAKVTFHVQPFKYSMENPLVKTTGTTLDVVNLGNTTAKPKITIYGSGEVSLGLNGYQIFTIALETNSFITIDIAQMNATQEGTLMNRSVTGDYEAFILKIGKNTIEWSGTVTQVVVENYSRWI